MCWLREETASSREGSELDFERVEFVSPVKIFPSGRVVEHLENPTQSGSAAVENGRKNLPGIAQDHADARLLSGRVNDTDHLAVRDGFPRFERGELRGGVEERAPGLGREGWGWGEFGHRSARVTRARTLG